MSSGAVGGGSVRARQLITGVVRAPLRGLAVGAAVLALAVSGLFGGLDRVSTPRVPVLAVGAVFAGAPWSVAVDGAQVLSGQATPRVEREGDRWLTVSATVEVTSDASRGDVAGALRLVGVGGLLAETPSRVHLARDNTLAGFLHPGLPERVVFYWEQSGREPVPARIEVQIIGMTRRTDSLSGRQAWLDPAPHALVRVPVQDRRKPA